MISAIARNGEKMKFPLAKYYCTTVERQWNQTFTPSGTCTHLAGILYKVQLLPVFLHIVNYYLSTIRFHRAAFTRKPNEIFHPFFYIIVNINQTFVSLVESRQFTYNFTLTNTSTSSVFRWTEVDDMSSETCKCQP